jgi:hypothetical protein
LNKKIKSKLMQMPASPPIFPGACWRSGFALPPRLSAFFMGLPQSMISVALISHFDIPWVHRIGQIVQLQQAWAF